MKYNINNDNVINVFLDIEKELQKSNNILNELYKIDSKYSKTSINMQSLIHIINEFKKQKLDLHSDMNILLHYNGEPSVTLNLILLSILTKTKVVLDCNNYFLGINKFLIETVNSILESFQTEKLIFLYDSTSYNQDNVDKIICIDDINRYNSYLRKKEAKAKFYAFNYIDFYSDSDEFNFLEELIYKYAEENSIPIESYSELNISQAVEMIKSGFGKKVVLLTKNNITQKLFEENLKNKSLYINENPFDNITKIINKEIFDI